MTVAFFQASLLVGGAERITQRLINALKGSRVRPIAINLYEPGAIGHQLLDQGETVHSGLASGKFDFSVGKRLAQIYEDEKVEVVYVADSALPLFWAGRMRRARKTPKIAIGFHSTGKTGDHLQHALANRCAFPVADKFIALSQTHLEFLTRHFNLPRERFAILPVGVDVERFSPAFDKREAKIKVGFDPDHLVVGIVAALRPEKNLSMFLEAAKRLAPQFPQARFVIAGDGSERERLEQEAREMNLQNAVQFLGMRNDTPDLYRAFDISTLCSGNAIETFPQVFVEAQASGVPIVSTNVGSIKDTIADQETGFLVPMGDTNAFAEKIKLLLSEPDVREAMGKASRQRAEKLFTIESTAAAYEKLFLDLANPGGNTR